jgi:hypothetical protein
MFTLLYRAPSKETPPGQKARELLGWIKAGLRGQLAEAALNARLVPGSGVFLDNAPPGRPVDDGKRLGHRGRGACGVFLVQQNLERANLVTQSGPAAAVYGGSPLGLPIPFYSGDSVCHLLELNP